MTGRVGGLVQVNDTRADVGLDVTLQRRASIGDRGEVAGSHKDCYPVSNLQVLLVSVRGSRLLTLVVVFEQKRPAAGVESRSSSLGLDGVVLLNDLLDHGVLGHREIFNSGT